MPGAPWLPLLASLGPQVEEAARVQSVLEPAGPQSARVAALWWFAFAVATTVYLATMAALAWAVWHARRRVRRGEAPGAGAERRMTRGVAWGVGATVVILLVFLSYDLSVGRALSPAPANDPLTIQLVGHQWWWEVVYPDSAPQRRVTTANELHVPVGEPVVVVLESRDVIHSVWIPQLGGKKDLIPGYKQSFWFQADTAGVYRGQCAEFCGHQHAKMALLVIAEPRVQFEQWLAQSRSPAATPSDPVARRGEEVFLAGPCVMCHAIEGTPAGSRAGPDLTHLATRLTLGAGTLPNTRGNLAGWIVDPQRIKPGVRMPPNALSPGDLDALLTYLQGLK